MNSQVTKAIIGGVVGTILLTFMMYVGAPVMIGQKLDMAARLSSAMGGGWLLGMLAHVGNGIVIFPLVYVFVVSRFLPGPPWLRGIVWGVILWLTLQVVMMPILGGGFFSSAAGGGKVAMAALIGHLVYGVALGAIAGGPESHTETD